MSTVPVVVIGAGASGLAAVKCCVEEGLDVVCFEKTEDIGGLWRFREDNVDGVACVMRSTVINSSKEMSCYSDFPPPADFANFMHHKQLAKYFELYADAFDLRRRLRLGQEVVSVVPAPDHAHSGFWHVVTKDLKTNEVEQMIARAVMVCSGHHSYPYIPDIPGLANFEGKVLHSKAYKDFRGFEDLRVVVVGIGNSGGDIAVELSHVSSKVYLSTRRGTWVLNRVSFWGLPLDYLFLRRFIIGPDSFVPRSVFDYVAQQQMNAKFDHSLYNLKPSHKLLAQHPMINDSLPNRILSGMITVKSDIHHFTPGGVVFKYEEDNEYEVDAVILATGYDIRYPFIDPEISQVDAHSVHLYKNVFPTSLAHPTLAFIGLIQPWGSIVPISEMQARWVARVFSGKAHLPSTQTMDEDVARNQTAVAEKFVRSHRHTLEVEYMNYMDEIAELIDVKPNLRRLLFDDFKLFVSCTFGANVPYQYRLDGPHKWQGAREAILRTKERVVAPMQTRRLSTEECHQVCMKVTSSANVTKGFCAFVAMSFGIFMVVLCYALF